MSETLEKMTNLESKVFMLLPLGASNSISIREIKDTLGIGDRYIMEIIHALVLQYGIPVGSFRNKKNGYFIAINEEEKEIGTRALSGQVNTMKKRLEKVKEADFETAMLYREEYKGEIKDYDEQLDMYKCLNLMDKEQQEDKDQVEYIEA